MNKTIQEIANEIPTQLKNLIQIGVSQPNQFIFAKFFYCLSQMKDVILGMITIQDLYSRLDLQRFEPVISEIVINLIELLKCGMDSEFMDVLKVIEGNILFTLIDINNSEIVSNSFYQCIDYLMNFNSFSKFVEINTLSQKWRFELRFH